MQPASSGLDTPVLVHGTKTSYSLKGWGLDLIVKLLLLAYVSEVLQWEMKQEMMELVL